MSLLSEYNDIISELADNVEEVATLDVKPSRRRTIDLREQIKHSIKRLNAFRVLMHETQKEHNLKNKRTKGKSNQ